MITDGIEMLKQSGFSQDVIDGFVEGAVDILNDYSELIGIGSEFRYLISKKIGRIELKMIIPGEAYDPYKTGSKARERRLNNITNLNLNIETTKYSYRYLLGNNLIMVSVPLSQKEEKILKDPMVIATLSAVVLGLLARYLPVEIRSFIIDELASPFLKILLNCLSGIMGPVIFISLTTSIIALDDINNLTNLGFKIMKRFVLMSLFLTLLSIVVSAFFFTSVGSQSISFDSSQLIRMIFDLIPTNLFEPFIENNTAQLVVLGLLLGSALLMLGDRVRELNDILMQINEWMMSAMKIVLMAVPLIPFLSLFTNIANGEGALILEGWKFILASYITYALAVVIKLIRASRVTGLNIKDSWNKMKPIVSMAFTTGSTAAPIRKAYEISEDDFAIKKEFSAFWIPMCSAMFSPKTTVNVVIATLMLAEISGIAATPTFLLVLILVTMELSIASPGTTSAWAIMFETFSLPVEYVGLFAVYRMFTANFGAAGSEALVMLEQVEAAHKLDGIKEDRPEQP